MSTIFVRIDVSLEGNDLSAKLSAQGDALSAIGRLIADPPTSLGDLGGALSELPLPDLAIGGSFAASLQTIREAVPADLASVTGDLTAEISAFAEKIQHDIARLLNETLGAFGALHDLLRIDLTCRDEAAAGGGPAAGGDGGGAADPGGAGGDAAAPAERVSGVAAATAQVDAIHSVLDAAPVPFDVEGVLEWLRRATDLAAIRGMGLPLHLPILDDLAEPLQTLHEWRASTPAEIRDQMGGTLEELATFVRETAGEPLASLEAALAGAAGNLRADDLATIADELSGSSAALRAAVLGGNLAGTEPAVASINLLLDRYEALRPLLRDGLLSGLPELVERLENLADDLADRIGHVQSTLRPGGGFSFLEGSADPTPADQAGLALIDGRIRPVVDWARRLSEKLDLKAIQTPLQAASNAARTAADGLEGGLTAVTIQVRSIFGRVESQLDLVDVQALIDEIEGAIDGFGESLGQKLSSLSEPARDALALALETLDEALDGFDPDAIVQPLRDAIGSLVGVLQDAETTEALATIRNVLEDVQRAIESLSFAPLTDEVIGVIGEVTAALEAIDPAKLNPALQAALQAAVVVLPSTLEPVTGPLTGEFTLLIDNGPVPLLDSVKRQPALLLERIKGFQPDRLVGSALAGPFADLSTKLDAFEPSRLVAPVTAELARLEGRLKTIANPSAPLSALEAPFAAILAAFDRLEPDGLVRPIEEAIQRTIEGILTALPVDEVFEQVDQVLGTVDEVVNLGVRVESASTKLGALFTGFADSRNQVESWVDEILDKIEAIDGAETLTLRFASVSAALDATRAAAISTRFQTAVGPLLAALGTLAPRARLVGLVQAHATFPRTALAALPDSPEKSSILAALDRFDPLDPEFGSPYQGLAGLTESLGRARVSLEQILVGWDGRYHAAGGLLDGFRVASANPTELRAWVDAHVRPRFVEPVRKLFGLLEALGAPIGSLLTLFRDFVGVFQTKIADLLLGPDSLGAIRTSLGQLVDRLRGFDFEALRAGLRDLFAELRGKVEALDPAKLRASVESAFQTVLDGIGIDQLFPAAGIAALDARHTELKAKLAGLDPARLVVELIQPEFEATIPPLLAAFDLTSLLDALVTKLRGLVGELSTELERVDAAYRSMLSAVPPLSPTGSISIDLSF